MSFKLIINYIFAVCIIGLSVIYQFRKMSMGVEVPIIGIARHRLATDGKGVTTLVAFHGCTLRCNYCLNPQSITPDTVCRHYTPQELYETVCIDQLYFLATGGGVTYGGGEPCLRSEFIAQFRALCGPQWQLTIETCLNVPRHHLEQLLPIIDSYIVDIKELNPIIYESYTTKQNQQVIDNLHWLAEQGRCEQVRIRVPHIPGFNTDADVDKSVELLHQWGFSNIEQFTYITSKTNKI